MLTREAEKKLNYTAIMVGIFATIFAPGITFVVAQAIHEQRIETVEREVNDIRRKSEVGEDLLRQILQRLTRMEAKLETPGPT